MAEMPFNEYVQISPGPRVMPRDYPVGWRVLTPLGPGTLGVIDFDQQGRMTGAAVYQDAKDDGLPRYWKADDLRWPEDADSPAVVDDTKVRS